MTGTQSRAAVLAVAMAASAAMWVPLGRNLAFGTDELELLAVSRRIGAGEWGKLLAPQDVHVFPLYRLARVYFDWRFPLYDPWTFGAAVAAHLASALLLYALSRQWFETAAAAVAAAGVFGWHASGGEVLFIKTYYTFVWSLPLTLGALYALTRGRAGWAGVLLLGAVGLHSMAAALSIPGVLAGYYLLGRDRSRDRAAWLACGIPFLTAVALWAALAGRGTTVAPGLPSLWVGARETLRLFSYLVWLRDPDKWMVAAALTGLALVMTALWGRVGARWVLTAILLVAVPVGVGVAIRKKARQPRYRYPAGVALAVAAGGAVDAVSRRWKGAAVVLLLAAAPVYYWQQRRHRDSLSPGDFATTEFLEGWNRALEGAVAGAEGLRLPAVQLKPWFSGAEFVAVAHPGGDARIRVLAAQETRSEDCLKFWQAVKETPVAAGKQLLLVRGGERRNALGVVVCRPEAETP